MNTLLMWYLSQLPYMQQMAHFRQQSMIDYQYDTVSGITAAAVPTSRSRPITIKITAFALI